jgi:hypothetical protein
MNAKNTNPEKPTDRLSDQSRREIWEMRIIRWATGIASLLLLILLLKQFFEGKIEYGNVIDKRNDPGFLDRSSYAATGLGHRLVALTAFAPIFIAGILFAFQPSWLKRYWQLLLLIGAGVSLFSFLVLALQG